jgi:hypothetical protein
MNVVKRKDLRGADFYIRLVVSSCGDEEVCVRNKNERRQRLSFKRYRHETYEQQRR